MKASSQMFAPLPQGCGPHKWGGGKVSKTSTYWPYPVPQPAQRGPGKEALKLMRQIRKRARKRAAQEIRQEKK